MTESEAIAGQDTPVQGRSEGRFASDVLKLVGGTTFAQALSVLVAPILARLYAPDAFGAATVFASITAIIGVVACLRYELAIMLPERDEDAANVLAVSLCSVLLFTGLSAVFVLFARDLLVRLLNAPDIAPFLYLVPLAVLADGGFLALNYWNSRTRHFARLSIARASQSVLMNGTQLGVGALGQAQAGGLIGARVVGSVVVTAVLGGQIWRDDRKLLRSSVRLDRVSDALKRYRKFPLLEIWGALLSNISLQLPALILSAFFSQTIVGYYALANRLVQLPMTLIGGAIAQVFFQRASETFGRQADLAGVVEMVFRRLVALGLLPALLMAVVGRELFVVVFGQNWAEAGIYVQILGLWMFFRFISSPLSTLFAVLERQELALIVHSAIFVARFLPLLIGGMLGDIYLALGLFAGSGVFVYGGLAIWNLALAGVPVRSSFHTLFRYLLYSAPAILVLLMLKAWFMAPMWIVLMVSAVALLAYYVLIMRQDRQLYRYFVSLLNRS